MVIIGAGFGGLTVARALRSAPVQITVIDRSNYHLFQPLLYQVATADLSPADIAAPIRSVLHKQRNTSVVLAEVLGVDRQAQHVLLPDRAIPYDYLVIATGAHHSYFGHDAWEPFAPVYWLPVPSVRKMDRLPLRMRSFSSLFSSRDAIHTEEEAKKISFPASASNDKEARQ